MRRIFNTISIAALLLAGLTLAPAFVSAQSGSLNSPSSASYNTPSSASNNSVFAIQNPLGKIDSPCKFVKAIFNIFILFGIPVATLFIMVAGFRLVMARGAPEELGRARKNLMYTLIGVGVFAAAWLFASVISNTIALFGIQILGSCT